MIFYNTFLHVKDISFQINLHKMVGYESWEIKIYRRATIGSFICE